MTFTTVLTSGLLTGLAGLAALAVIALLLLGGPGAQAQSDPGAVSNLSLSSPKAGELAIAWDAPDDTPTDYRVVWAPSSEDFPSWKAANTASKGNGYPTAASYTVAGLASGTEYKARVRARYASGGDNDDPWSGPWSGTATVTISSPPDPTPAPTATAEPTPDTTPAPTPQPTPEPTPAATPQPTPDATPAATPEPTPEPTPTATPDPTPQPTAEPADGEVTGLALSSPNPGELTISWNTPSPAPDGYRVVWAPSGEDFPSYESDNTSSKGNAYPTAASYTVSGLAQGTEYKARVRARYRDGDHKDTPWSGPWSGVATITISPSAERSDAKSSPPSYFPGT